MAETVIILNDLVKFAVIIMSIWGFVKIVMEIIHAIVERSSKEKKWDSYEETIRKERKEITDRYDKELKDLRDEFKESYTDLQKQIDDNHTDTEAKIQEVRAELYILTECMQGVLDGLHQLNCNGKVTEAQEKLDSYLNKRAHSA